MAIVSNCSLDQHASTRRDIPLDETQKALLRRGRFLLPHDRLLLDLVMKNRLSRRQVAMILGLEPGTVTRRLQRLGQRLHDPLVLALTDSSCRLAPDYRQLGIEHFLQGLSSTELADRHQIPRAHVRQMLAYIRGWHRGRSHV